MPLFQISLATSRDFPETQTGITGDHIIPGAEPEPEGGHLIHNDPAHIEPLHHLVTGALLRLLATSLSVRVLEAVAGQHCQYVPDVPPVQGLNLLPQRIDTNRPGVDRLWRLCSLLTSSSSRWNIQ